MTEEMSKKVIEFTRDYYRYSLKSDDNCCIERDVDYRDEFPESIIHKVLNSDEPKEIFDSEIDDWNFDCDDWLYENEFFKELRVFCEENEIEEEDATGIIYETFYWSYPESFLNPDVSTMWIINHGDMNYDFTKHNVLNYASNYGYCDGLEKEAGLWWLAKQQGYLSELQDAIKEKNPKHYFSTRELISKLNNLAFKLSSSKNYNWNRLNDLRRAEDIFRHTETWEWFLDRDGEDDPKIRELVTKLCKENKISIFEYVRSNFTDTCVTELLECTHNICALQFFVKMPLQDIIKIKQSISDMEKDKGFDRYNPMTVKKDYGFITLSKDTMCGLFDPCGDGGSVCEIELDKDVKIPLKYLWDIRSNKNYQDCCSVVESCWKETIKEINLKEIA